MPEFVSTQKQNICAAHFIFKKSIKNDYDKTIEFKEWLKFLILHAAFEYLFRGKEHPAMLRESEISDHNPCQNNLETGLSYDDLIKMLHQLPCRTRAVFNLFAIEGYEHEKIAGMLNISISSSKLLLAQARGHLNCLTSIL